MTTDLILSVISKVIDWALENELNFWILACCTALQTLLKHVRFQDLNSVEEYIAKSLVLMKDLDEDVRTEYEYV